MKQSAIYIKSLSASALWENNNRKYRPLREDKFKGSLPYSLESEKLQQTGLEVIEVTDKRSVSHDLINVKFDGVVKSGSKILENIPNWIEWKEESIKKVNKRLKKVVQKKLRVKLQEQLQQLNEDLVSLHSLEQEIKDNKDHPIWREINQKVLREKLYADGFDLDVYDGKKKEFVKVHYVMYKRSTAKSRNGQVWFIREDLHEEMDAWSNLRLDFSKDNVDLTGLMAYQSLVTSTIVDKITIDPESILLIDKVVSKFNDKEVNVIGLKDKMLNCVPKHHPIENEIFDGSALLDSSCFVRKFEDRGFLQLRGSFFKCAAFNVDLRGFFKDWFKDEYETATVNDMFGKPVKVSKIKMIINPSDLKALKYSYAVGSQEDMWNHWKEFTRTENNSEFGVCKWEKLTKRTDKDELDAGLRYQQMSYQMVNSLPTDYKGISKLAKFEIDYIGKLKNEPLRLMEYLKRNANRMNANQMFVDLYEVNEGIIETSIFRSFKKEVIRKYREHLQSGGIRIPGDYTVMGGNLVEYMLAAVGVVKGEITDSLVFKENEIYTPLFPAGEVVGFRNPHVSPANIIRLTNIRPDLETEHKNEYHKYFKYIKVTENIAIVNSCHSLLNDTLNGCDFDGDVLLVSNSPEILSMMDKVEVKYLAPVNDIPLKKNSKGVQYTLDNASKAKIDNKGMLGQRRIGSITNLGQQACSIMWNELHKPESERDMKKVSNLLEIVNALAVCSGLAIDGAKREYELDLGKQITHFRKVLDAMLLTHEGEIVNTETGEITPEEMKVFPKFWKYVKETDKKVKDTEDKDEKSVIVETEDSEKLRKGIYYNTPMDWLYYKFEKLNRGNGVRNPRKLVDLLYSGRIKDGDRRKQGNIEEIASESQSVTNSLYAVGFSNESEEEEMIQEIEEQMSQYDRKMSKIKMDQKTMFALLAKISNRTEEKKADEEKAEGEIPNLRLMLHLYRAYPELFLGAFKQETSKEKTA
ncbi:hypothetical protein EVU96_24775 [Bacillus infantis]|uniref:hypothetical protein n=1 Tax=Bacillus infantis TaxID=324767 RepID=UPI00101DF4AD|nr:hypothetical protein [Bacillus infantis]RYI25183.1 hypothetical protein EVU96_24775 [Bacillus infantis]